MDLLDMIGSFSGTTAHLMVKMLPKATGGFRPIGLFPALIRVWGKARQPALRAWADFCDLTNCPHFPVNAGKAAQFGATCREPGTYAQYISHIKSANEFLGFKNDFPTDIILNRAKTNITQRTAIHLGRVNDIRHLCGGIHC